ncbi:MAG TPA: hypothetical protein VK457_24325 [Chloroflexota bacterium]|nr:hypothetical protein [Chloroflexota bacterium]
MKRLVISLALLASFALPATAAAQTAPAPCQFVLGFKALHDLDANDVGDCIDSQFLAQGNGDQQQHTTKGLMAWRKSDNWTAFTNGYKTWINGPNGLVSRLNSDRFPWEKDTPAAAPAPATAPAPAPAASSGAYLDIRGPWRLENNNTIYSVQEDQDGYIVMMPNSMRQCTSSGQSVISGNVDFKSVRSPMNTVFTGTLGGNTITGNWLVCATVNQSWVPMPVTFTLAADGNHMSGQLQETLTFDRIFL